MQDSPVPVKGFLFRISLCCIRNQRCFHEAGITLALDDYGSVAAHKEDLQEQAAFLQRLGCEAFQGFLYHHSMPDMIARRTIMEQIKQNVEKDAVVSCKLECCRIICWSRRDRCGETRR